VIDKGYSGIKTDLILTLLESNLDTYHPDMVITMMGINDHGAHLPYETISGSKAVNFLKSCRTYKLARLLWLHIVTRLKEFNESDFFLSRSKMPQAHVKEKNIPASEPLSKYEEMIKSGNSYRNEAEFFKAEKLYRKAIELNSQNEQAYIELGSSYRKQDKFSEAEATYKKAIELNPKSDKAYLEFGFSYKKQGQYPKAEESFKKAIELNPKNAKAYLALGYLFEDQQQFSAAAELYKKAIACNPAYYEAYIRLGDTFSFQGKYSEAEEAYKKAIKLSVTAYRAYPRLGMFYQKRGKHSEAVKLLEKFIELSPDDHRAYRSLGVFYEEMGNSKLAQEYGEKAKELRSSRYNPTTVDNYRKLREILNKRGITYVCAQYPMRDLESLKKIFRGDTEGIIFVDNEQLFKNAVQRDGYREYFRDMLGGDFGHCTQKGNRLLAENIANTLLKEVFGK